MARYFFHIAYNGANYRGWQKQKKVLTIQQIFEERLKSIFKRKVYCLGCGRTDAGVHASQYFFHSDIKEELPNNLSQLLNKILPKDIVVLDIILVEGTPHAQFSAKERTYDYLIHTIKNPFLADISSYYELQNLNFKLMNQAAQELLNYSDFRAFCKTPDRHDSTVCEIKSVKLFRNAAGDKLKFKITADRFLKSMIRIIVYNLIEIGKGKLSLQEFKGCLDNNIPPKYFNLAYPQGLYLSKIVYPFLSVETNKDIYPNKEDWHLII